MFYSRFKFTRPFLFKCFSTWEWFMIWKPLTVSAALPRATESKICVFYFLYQKHTWISLVQSDLLKLSGRTSKRIESLLVLILKYDRKIPVEDQHFQKSYRLQVVFLKVSLHFKKMADSLRKTLQTYSEICTFCVMQYIDFLKQSVGGALKLLGKSLKIISDEVNFIVHLCS